MYNSEHKITIWDNSRRASNVLKVFILITVITILDLVVNYTELTLLTRLQLGQAVTNDELSFSDDLQKVVGIFQLLAFIASMIFFLNWFRRAYGNLHRIGVANLRHSESMAVWSFFIPIIVLFRPYKIMMEIWEKTQDTLKVYNSRYIIKKGGTLIGAWWGLFIVTNLIGRFLLKVVFEQNSLAQIIESTQATILSDIIQIPEAILLLYIVWKLSKAEQALAQKIQQTGGSIEYH